MTQAEKEASRFYFGFEETEQLRSQSVGVLPLDPGELYKLKRHGRNTLGDVIDNWYELKRRGVPGLGKKTQAKVHAAFFSYMVNRERSDSVKILL